MAELTRWRGFVFEKFGSGGLVALFFSIGYLGINFEEARLANVYQGARPVQKHDGKHAVYVTGKLIAGELKSTWIKPGRYLRIDQSSEVFAWEERTAGKNQQISVSLQWTNDPKDPKTFRTDRNHPLFTKKVDEKPVYPTDGRIEQDGKKYAVAWPDLELPASMSPKAPKPEQLAPSAFAVTEPMGEEILVLYESEACKSAPTPGCQRVLLGLVPAPETITVIGGLDGDRLVKLEGTLKGAEGDVKALMKAFSFSAGVTSFFSKAERMLCMGGIWISLASLQRPLRRVATPLASRSTAELSFLGALLLSGITWLVPSWTLLIAVVAVGGLLAASREPKTT